LLNAQFLAAVHVIVYAGAIMVLFLYVIMLLNLNQDSEPHKNTLLKFAAIVTAGLLMVVIVGALRGAESAHVSFTANPEIGLVKNLGRILFNEFLLPFEIVSLLLLAAMVGAVMLGKTHMKRAKEFAHKKNGKGNTSAMNIKNINELTK
jgi:NADH-quinone oxidoreductase subunit J